ncbi:MAG: hypothetical protein AAGA92_01440 [Planctomycetota bacterium]
MSVGPFSGVVGSAAGAPLPQQASSEPERASEARSQERKADTDQQADKAAGIGQTEEDQQSSDRDADGRRLWENPAGHGEQNQEDEEAAGQRTAERPRPKDPTGNCGNGLDLTG